ncbi:hypothetical protein CSZ94_12090 [Janthinobacterium sp. ROICE36]|uniref:hypothetical protein n=1 Tax=Janthinobacterium sp. ROICE36 TaxID=2048670 RepID=UPI000C7F2136|nr:hypothetical protein [Janthinobacterium sp. ROICE36]PLY42113.1 hypothetical protein CSZ94_12090 [Janthinobacterium sp. ROICE36]
MSTPINNPIWAGPCLFTPLYLEALMTGQKNQTGDWAAVAVQYDQLGLRGGQVQPSAFQVGTPPATGIQLIWTPPSALRHGQTDELGGVSYPWLPNRWLVTRSFIAEPGDVPAITAWVLESDYLGPQGARSFPDPSGGTTAYLIGRRFDIGAWAGTTSTYDQPFLQAMGPGDPSYVAIYDNMSNVLAFHDDMQGAANGLYSYSVCGWFATPSCDLLYGKTPATPDGFTSEAQWQDIMARMRWTVGNDADLADAEQNWQAWLLEHPVTGGPALTPAQQAWPAQNLCHGMVYNLQWHGPAAFYPINPILQGTTPPTVAVGANSAESLSAWLASAIGSADAEDLLLAFQQDMIFDYVRNPSAFYMQAQAARFASSDGGRQWIAYQSGQTSSSGTIPSGSYSVPLDASATDALTALNSQQAALDSNTDLLAALQWQLYAAYWKKENCPRADPDYQTIMQLVQQQIASLTPQIDALSSQIAGQAAQLEQSKAQLLARIAPLQLALDTVNQARFDYRQDPVILLAGANQDTKFAPPGIYDDDSALFTRFTGQTIRAIHVVYSSDAVNVNVTLNTADFADIAWPTGVLIPKEMGDYWFETFLLDTNSARLIAQRAFAKAGVTPTPAQLAALTQQIQAQQTLLWNPTQYVDARTLAETAGMLGVPPMKSSVALWTPPWSPIFLDWEIEWHPSALTPQHMLDDWVLGEIDFEWLGTQVAAMAGLYSGRSLVNGEGAQGLKDKLNDFLDSDPNAASLPQYQLDQLRQMAATIGRFDVLTQSMSGVVQQLIMQQLKMSKLNAIQQAAVAKYLLSAASYLPATAGPFFPIHAGHFRFTRLQVVDAYGQILRGSQLSDNLVPIRSKSLTTPGAGTSNQQYMQLAPRVTQGQRLDFRMVQFDNDAVRSNSSDQTSPICGWVIPNHIDHSMVVFDAEGNNLGEVLMIDNSDDGASDGTGLRWDAVPGSNSVLGGAPEFGTSLRHLNGFVNGLLLSAAQGSSAMQSLLDVIDASLWKVDPLGQPMQGNLAILLGRPLAMVRALVTLGVDGTPACDQSYLNTGKNVTNGFTSVPLPLRIGDIGLSNNGVMGYFLDDDFSHFYPYHGYDPTLAVPRRVIASGIAPAQMLDQIDGLLAAPAAAAYADAGANPYVVANPGFSLPPDCSTTHTLTILVDPRGWIPAISGYLPVQWLSLPAGPVNKALSTMFVTFRTGPVLLETAQQSAQIALPLPAAINGKWTWVERSGVTTWSESAPLASSDSVAGLPASRPVLSEGWLKLSGAEGSP